MDKMFFPGQQEGEKILYHAKPHPGVKYLSFGKVVVFGLLVLFFFQIMAVNLSDFAPSLRLIGLVLTTILIIIGLWWSHTTHEQNDIYITDRRIVKFAPLSPFHRSTRALFWDEAVKAKTYYQNALLESILGIGSLEIHARSQDKDNVDINHLIYHEDLANYIDKILYTFKNKPEELKDIKEFVPKPRGERG